MDVAASSRGSILLAETTDVDRPDVGIVIGAGEDTDLEPGDHVLVPPFAGIWFRDFVVDGLKLWEVRFYGIQTVDEYLHESEDIDDVIVARVEEDGLKPRGEWVLLKRDEQHDTTEGGILLTDRDCYRTHKATVMAVGTGRERGGKIVPLEVQPGDRVVYHGPGQHVGLKGLLDLYPDLEGDSKDYSLIKESDIYAIIS